MWWGASIDGERDHIIKPYKGRQENSRQALFVKQDNSVLNSKSCIKKKISCFFYDTVPEYSRKRVAQTFPLADPFWLWGGKNPHNLVHVNVECLDNTSPL